MLPSGLSKIKLGPDGRLPEEVQIPEGCEVSSVAVSGPFTVR